MRLFIDTDRGWATAEMISMLKETAAYMSQQYPGKDRLQVEDLSAQFGGKITRHASHQNGLDVDLQFYRVNALEHDPLSTGKLYALSMVEDESLSTNFDLARNWQVMKALHRFGDVQRIFIDKVIKQELCQYAKSINEYEAHTEVLRSMRHVPNHQDHFHVRLRCPKGASLCKSQSDIAYGSGCL